MNAENIPMVSAPDEYESLAVVLRALAASAGAELDYDDLCAALGVSFTAVATTVERSPGWWTTFGRDAYLESAAALFGMELRDLHPPGVAVEMVNAEEYAQHFEWSYTPLIRAALANGQPVLAQQGWAGDYWPSWGVIRAERDGHLVGLVPDADGEVELTDPALQCYVVQRCEAHQPGQQDLLTTAIRHADAYMNHAPFAGEPGEMPVIITGPQAFDAWEQWLTSDDLGPDAWNEHLHHAACISAARSSGARFLTRHRAALPGGAVEDANQAIAQCEAIVGHLAESCDANRVQDLIASVLGREELLQQIRLSQAADRRLAVCFEHLAAV